MTTSQQEVSQYQVGMIVDMVTKPEWGPGKIVHVSGDNLHILFRDQEEKIARMFRSGAPSIQMAATQTDPILDNLPPLTERAGRWELPRSRISLAAAERKFLHHFPMGFADPKYASEERDYKISAHNECQEILSRHEIRRLLGDEDMVMLIKRGVSLLTGLNLLSPYERAAFKDSMEDVGAARNFYSCLLQLLDAPQLDGPVFERYADAVLALPAARGRVATWPVATALPFLSDPALYMFMKPEVTQVGAETLGFDLQYDPRPNWTTYSALLRMGNVYLKLLEHMGARDYIDVQSFIYVVGGGYD